MERAGGRQAEDTARHARRGEPFEDRRAIWRSTRPGSPTTDHGLIADSGHADPKLRERLKRC